jgi:hypothetical protein
MLWINASEFVINFRMDLGNGREHIVLRPSETIEIPDKPVYMAAVKMEAPQLQPYEPILEELAVEQVLEIKPAPPKRGRKPKAN